MRIIVFERGFEEIHAALLEFGPGFANRLVGPGLAAATRVVARRAKQRGFEFTDRTGRLRRSIRTRRATFRDGSRRVPASTVRAGGPGARQASLVELGQPGFPKAPPFRGGPQDARPRPFITEAQLQTIPAQEEAFSARVRERFPTLLAKMKARAGRVNTLGATFGRRVSLRGRRRR